MLPKKEPPPPPPPKLDLSNWFASSKAITWVPTAAKIDREPSADTVVRHRIISYTFKYKKTREQIPCYCKSDKRAKAPCVSLCNHWKIPQLGLGTWLGFNSDGSRVEVTGDEVKKAVELAIDKGYRHFDTAAIYMTEEQVGDAIQNKIKEGVVRRDQLFITTKLWNNSHAKHKVVPALRESLKRLQLDYVDLYLIHWPVGLNDDDSFDDCDYLETWEGMVQAKTIGLTRSIGLSNFNEEQIQRLLVLSRERPTVLQIEVNLNLQQQKLRAFCQKHHITVVAYSPFGSLVPSKATADAPRPQLTDPLLQNIATKHNKTVFQIILRYLVELGTIPIPKSINEDRIAENIDIFDFTLNDMEKKLLKAFDYNYRTVPAKRWVDSLLYPFEKKVRIPKSCYERNKKLYKSSGWYNYF